MKVRVLVLALVGLFAGCGGDSGDSGEAKQEKPKQQQPKEITIAVDQQDPTVRANTVVLTGHVTEPDATVQVGDKELTPKPDGTFRARVPLPKVGDNTIFVDARKPGFDSDSMTVVVTRALTAAERQARAERRRQRREAALADLRASAQELDPELLQKDPDRYTGTKVVMTGEIFQIQEGGDNFLLMDTGCSTEYDITICDGPTVYVTYPFGTDATEEDVVTVYGVVRGGYEYDTQIGGTNYVGHIAASIIE